MVHEAKGEAMIAQTASAIRVAGKDGELRVTLAISGTPAAILAATAEWAALVGVPFEYTTKPITPTRYGTRQDDDDVADDDDGSRWNDDADGQALASVYGANDE